MSVAAAHPPLDQLRAFHCGRLGGADADAVEGHLAGCDECANQLLLQPDDALLLLARGRPPGEAAAETALAVGDGDTSPAGAAEELPAELVGHPRYRVLRPLGSGGMGAVYLAEHLKMGRKVALKVIRPGLTSGAAGPRFRQEVRAAARLSHPNIVQAHDADEAGELHFLVMEYVEGTDLARLLRARGPLPAAEACEYARQAALGLQHAHEQGMVHRDVKPHNLMVTARGQVKILDFGLAGFARDAARDEGSQLTGSGTVMGTADYIAPEQARDAHAVDIRADIYSLGCTLYQLLSGRVPFESGSVVEKMVRHAIDAPEPLAARRPDLPAALVRVVEKMMAKRPEERFPTPAAVAAALAPFTQEHTDGATPAAPGGGRTTGRLARAALVFGLVGLAALGVAAGAVYRIQTDNGEIVITTASDDVEVTISKGGKTFTILDTKTKKKLTLPTGEYDLTLSGSEGFTLSTDKVTIRRGKETLVTVERVRTPAADAGPKAVPPSVGAGGPGGSLELLHTFRSPVGPDLGCPVLSPDGRYVSAVGGDGRVFYLLVWEVATGKLVREIACPALGQARGRFASHALLPGGRVVAAYETVWNPSDFRLQVWDIATGKGQPLGDGLDKWPVHLRAARAGKFVAFASASPDSVDDVRLCDGATGKVVATVTPLRHKSLSGVAHFTPDDKFLVTIDGWDDPDARHHNELRWTDVTTGREARRVVVKGWLDWAHVGFFADGRTLVVARHDKQKGYSAEFLDAEAGTSLRVQPFGPADGLDGVRISPDGRFGVLLNADKTVHVYDLRDGRELTTTEVRFAGAGETVFSADGSLMALSTATELRVFRLPSATPHRLTATGTTAPEPKPTIPAPRAVPPKVGFQRTITVPYHLPNPDVPVLSPDGSRVALLCNPSGGAGAGWALVWDTHTGELIRTLRSPGRWFTSVNFLPDGRLLTAHENLAKNGYPFLAWNLATGQPEPVGKLPDFPGWTSRVGATPDGKYVWVRYYRTKDTADLYRVYEVATGKLTAEIPAPSGEGDVRWDWYALTPDSKHFVTLDALKREGNLLHAECQFRSCGTGKVDHRIPFDWSPYPGTVSGDGKTLVVFWGSETKPRVDFVDVASGKTVRKLPLEGIDEWVGLRFAPGGRFAAFTFKDSTVRFIDLADGKEVYRSGPKFRPEWPSFSQDGRVMMLGSASYEIHIFRLPDAGGK